MSTQRLSTPAADGQLDLVDEGDAQLSREQEAAYEAESDRYARQGPPEQVLAAFADRRGRPRVGEQLAGHSPRIGARVSADTREAVRRAAQEEGLSEAQWLRAAIDERLHRTGRTSRL
ncbi:hypothetical protein GCM10027586_14980 [Kineococcus gypseus]|uniref:hypothetical protein n=1 Tax=Kineococcus gypseus TaxID=1637102 RepID=UPI003D7EA47B